MTCFDRDELSGLIGGFLGVVAPWTHLAAAAFGWALAVLASQLMHRPPAPTRRARRRRRPPLRVLASPTHNPDLDGVHAPPPEEET